MAKVYPQEFRDDVVRVARLRESPLTQVARDFDVSDGTLHDWLKRAEIEGGLDRVWRRRTPRRCAISSVVTKFSSRR